MAGGREVDDDAAYATKLEFDRTTAAAAVEETPVFSGGQQSHQTHRTKRRRGKKPLHRHTHAPRRTIKTKHTKNTHRPLALSLSLSLSSSSLALFSCSTTPHPSHTLPLPHELQAAVYQFVLLGIILMRCCCFLPACVCVFCSLFSVALHFLRLKCPAAKGVCVWFDPFVLRYNFFFSVMDVFFVVL